jgi:queuine tRNA-ribosyltransferase
MLGAQLNTLHNLHFYQKLMQDLRQAIEQGRLSAFAREFAEAQQWLSTDLGNHNPA